MKRFIYLALSVMLLMATAAAKHWHDDDRGKGRGKGKGHADDERSCYFQQQDARVLDEYYGPRYRTLPPGLQKKLYRTGRLPPGWEKKLEPLPVVVEQRLTPLPSGYRRGFMDGYAVVYNPGTQIVIDIRPVVGRR